MNSLRITASILIVLSLIFGCVLPEAALSKPATTKKVVKTQKPAKKHVRYKQGVKIKKNIKKKNAVKKSKPAQKAIQKKQPALSVNTKTNAYQKTGQLFVYSKYQDSDVYVDEDFAGTAPVYIKGLKCGKHLVEIYRGKDMLLQQEVNIDSIDPVVLETGSDKMINRQDPAAVM